MELLGFFSKEKRLEKAIRRANNKHTPKDYRQVDLHKVIEAAHGGSDVAVRGLIARFAVNAEPSIEDEREKEWVCDALIEMGRKVLPQLKQAMRTNESVNWVHRVVSGIVGAEEYRAELLDALAEFDTEYERNPDRKIQTIASLGAVGGQEVVEPLLRFLADVDETVRYQTVAVLTEIADDRAREPLLEALVTDESIRLRNAIIEAFARLEWPAQGQKKKVEALLPAGFRLEKSGRIIQLGQAQKNE